MEDSATVNEWEPRGVRSGAECGVRTGFSTKTDANEAIDEIWEQTYQPDIKLAVFFCSSFYDLDKLGSRVWERFGDINIVGCTTAGEIGPGGYLSRSVSAFSLGGPGFTVATGCMDELSRFTLPAGRRLAYGLLNRLIAQKVDISAGKTFAFLLIDGLAMREEVVTSAIHVALSDMPFFGGSAADDLVLEKTLLYHRGAFRSDRAILSLVSTTRKFEVFKTQHFVESGDRFVITAADSAKRIVTEINGEPAAQEYADMVGVPVSELCGSLFASHPLILTVRGSAHARPVRSANDDLSMSFSAAVEQGSILTIGRPLDIVDDLRRLLDDIRARIGRPALLIGCDCCYRRMELEQTGRKEFVGDMFRECNAVGFATYGEQFGALHNGHTLSGVAIGEDEHGE